MIYRYGPEVHEFVKNNCTKMRDEELTEKCNAELGTSFTVTGMKAFRANHGYKNGLGMPKGEEYWKRQTKWPKGMYEYIRDNSYHVDSKEMAERVNKKFGTSFTTVQMKSFRQRNHITCGLTGWYQKGHEPGTKGKRQEEYMSQEAIDRTKATRFKKGDKIWNEQPIGTVIVTTDGFKAIKVKMDGPQPKKWKPLHRKVWEDHNGPIPEGMVITFKDSNPLNCELDNLLMVSKRENLEMNRSGYRFDDPELTETGLALVKMKQAAIDRRRKK